MSVDLQPALTKPDIKKHLVAVVIGQEPVLIRTHGEDVFPVEAAEDCMRQLQALIDQAMASKMPYDDFRFSLVRAMKMYKTNPRLAFNATVDSLNGIGAMLQPYTWIEGEDAEPHSFSEVALNEAASRGAFLMLNTESAPPAQGYAAQYRFTAPAEDMYNVWVACSTPGPSTSPFIWLMDTGQPVSGSEAVPVGVPYLGDGSRSVRQVPAVARFADRHALPVHSRGSRQASSRYRVGQHAAQVPGG